MSGLDVDEVIDTSDLDDLNISHAYCMHCLPDGPRFVVPGERFPGLCGADAYSLNGDIGDGASPPSHACPACLAVLRDGCRRCGRPG